MFEVLNDCVVIRYGEIMMTYLPQSVPPLPCCHCGPYLRSPVLGQVECGRCRCWLALYVGELGENPGGKKGSLALVSCATKRLLVARNSVLVLVSIAMGAVLLLMVSGFDTAAFVRALKGPGIWLAMSSCAFCLASVFALLTVMSELAWCSRSAPRHLLFFLTARKVARYRSFTFPSAFGLVLCLTLRGLLGEPRVLPPVPGGFKDHSMLLDEVLRIRQEAVAPLLLGEDVLTGLVRSGASSNSYIILSKKSMSWGAHSSRRCLRVFINLTTSYSRMFSFDSKMKSLSTASMSIPFRISMVTVRMGSTNILCLGQILRQVNLLKITQQVVSVIEMTHLYGSRGSFDVQRAKSTIKLVT